MRADAQKSWLSPQQLLQSVHLSGDRPIVIKYRSSKRALGRLGDEVPETRGLGAPESHMPAFHR